MHSDQTNHDYDDLITQVNNLNDELDLLQATIESQTDVLIFSIDKDYNYRAFNSAFKVATGYAYGTEVTKGGKLFDSITNEADQQKIRFNCERAFNGERHFTVEEFGATNPLYYETHYNPITNTKGDIVGVAVLSSNVTERVVAEEQIRTLNKELESFTYTAAHDLRVPLRVIDGYSKILHEDYSADLDPEAKRIIGIITTQVSHMGRLVDDLLAFAQMGRTPVVRRSSELAAVLRQIVEDQLRRTKVTHAEIVIKDILPCNCDVALIRIVLTNLVSNAIKFSSRREHPVIEINSYTEGSQVVYYVRDNGFGFDMKYGGKLFGVFQRLHKAAEYEGTGVGLAMVQRIIGKHGGKVWFDAEVDKGATFYFSLQA